MPRVNDLTTVASLESANEAVILQGSTVVKAPLNLLPFTPAGAGAAARPAQAKLREIVSITDFYANGVSGALVDTTGTTDSTLGIQAAINTLTSGSGTIFFPDGTYKTTSTITVAQDRIHLRGTGRWAAAISFAPTANDTCIEFSKGASVLYQCSLSDITFTSSDSTYTKIAVDVVDTSAFTMHDVVVGPLWNDATGSIGLRCRGREANVYDRLELYCDRPIVIADNPNSTLDIDHYHFSNLYLTCASATAHSCIEVDTGVNLSHVTFDGYQAWVKGGNGFKWVDTTTASTSNNLTIRNARHEQSTNATGYVIDIEHNSNLQVLKLENCYGGLNTLGIKLRKVIQATLENCATVNTSGNSLDVDTTVDPLILNNVYIQTGGTVSLGGLTRIYDAGPGAMTSASFSFTVLGNLSTITTTKIDVPLMGSSVSIAQDAAATIGAATSYQGYLFIITDEDVSAIYLLRGSTNTTAEVNDADGFFTPTKDSATAYNIYYEAPSYKIQNKRTGTHVVKYLFFGDSI